MDQNVKMVQIGNLKITVNALIILVTSIIMSVVLLFAVPMPIGAIFSIAVLLGGAFVSYNVNCVQVGHCRIWAIILVVIYVVNVVAIMLRLFMFKPSLESYSLMNSKKSPMGKKLESFRSKK